MSVPDNSKPRLQERLWREHNHELGAALESRGFASPVLSQSKENYDSGLEELYKKHKKLDEESESQQSLLSKSTSLPRINKSSNLSSNTLSASSAIIARPTRLKMNKARRSRSVVSLYKPASTAPLPGSKKQRKAQTPKGQVSTSPIIVPVKRKKPTTNFVDLDNYLRTAKKRRKSTDTEKNASFKMPGVHQARILLIEEDLASRNEASQILKEQKYIVTTVFGVEAMVKLQKESFDGIITAINLRGISGLDIAENIRFAEQDRGATTKVPIFAFTDLISHKDLRKYQQAGMNACISKPLEAHYLVDNLARAIPYHMKPLPPGASRPPTASTISSSSNNNNNNNNNNTTQSIITSQPSSPIKSTKSLLNRSKRPITPSSPSKTVHFSNEPMTSVTVRTRGSKATIGTVNTMGTLGSTMSSTLKPKKNSKRRKSKPKKSTMDSTFSRRMPSEKVVTLTMPIPEVDTDFNGFFQLDAETKIPFIVMGGDTPVTIGADAPPLFNLIVCNDLFDCAEMMQIFLRPIVSRQPGLRVLLWNYPGQAESTFRTDRVLNNKYMAFCLQELIKFVEEHHLFTTEHMFHMLGVGFGSSVAINFSTTNHFAKLRSIISVNGMLNIDEHLAAMFHDCKTVFSNNPVTDKTNPNAAAVPEYFLATRLFSDRYVKRVKSGLALNIRTAISNPITDKGRIALCNGALACIDMRESAQDLVVPFVAVCSKFDAFVTPVQLKALLDCRGGEVASIQRALKRRQGVCVIWMESGHAVFQECKTHMANLMEQMVTGFHETHDVSFVCLKPDQDELERTLKLEKDINKPKKLFEEKFIDNILSTINDHKKKGNIEDYRDSMMSKLGGTVASASMGTSLDNHPLGQTLPARTQHSNNNNNNNNNGSSPGKRLSSTTRSKATTTKRRKMNKTVKSMGGTRSGGAIIDGSMDPNMMRTLTLDPSNPTFERDAQSGIYKAHSGSKIYPVDEGVVKEYMGWRVNRNKRRLVLLHNAAISIQKSFRSYMARTLVRRMRMEQASLCLQRYWRGYLGRCVVYDKRRELWAVVLLQRNWRGKASRNKYRQRMMEEAAAVLIQRIYRGFSDHKKVSQLRQMRHNSATLIQTLWRKRKDMQEARQARLERNAAIDVQRVYRGHIGRRIAITERDKRLFSKAQTEGLSFARQMLQEHKIQSVQLQSDVSLLTEEKMKVEMDVEGILHDVGKLESGVHDLERQMQALARVETESLGILDQHAKAELREHKVRLDKQFAQMLAELAGKKQRLGVLEEKLQTIEQTRLQKEEQMRDLERKLVVLLEEQQNELEAIKKRQAARGEKTMDVTLMGAAAASRLAIANGNAMDQTSFGASSFDSNSSSMQSYKGPSRENKEQAAALLSSTEAMMKFGFMAMSMSNFAALNVLRSMKQVGTINTVLEQADQNRKMMENLTTTGAQVIDGAPTSASSAAQNALKQAADTLVKENEKEDEYRDIHSIRVSNWNCRDVCDWLATLELSQYRRVFNDATIDGRALFYLSDDDLKSTLHVEHKFHRKKILQEIQRLKLKQGKVEGQENDALRMQIGSYVPQINNQLMGSNASIHSQSMMMNENSGVFTQNSVMSMGGIQPMMFPPGGPPPAALMSPENVNVRPVTNQMAMMNATGRLPSSNSAMMPIEDEPSDNADGNIVDPMAFDQYVSWARHDKVSRLKEALKALPETPFDESLVEIQYIPGYGTQYVESVSKLAFHINKADENGNTLLHIASQNGHSKLSKLLCNLGSNPNHQNNNGNTPLHYCMSYGFYDLGSWLTDENGGRAKDDIANKNGLSPYDGLEA